MPEGKLPLEEAIDRFSAMLAEHGSQIRESVGLMTRRLEELGGLGPEQQSKEMVSAWWSEQTETVRTLQTPFSELQEFWTTHLEPHQHLPGQEGIRKLIEERNELFGQLVEAFFASVKIAEPGTQSRRRPGHSTDNFPTSLAQQTFQEMRNLGIALSDGPSGRRWQDIDGEVAMVHAIPDQPLHVRFSPSSLMLAWWSEPPTYAHLRTELREAGAPAVLLAHVVVALILERGKLTVSLDDLRHAIGWTRRESAIVEEQLARAWRMLLLLSSMPVIGKRNETYTDPRTGKTIDLVSRDPLIVVRGERYADGPPKATDVPLDVSLDAGAWIDQHRGNRRILHDFGDVLQLAKIPAGKPGGAWAQSIGLALNQRWRERAARTDLARVGEDGHQTVRFRQSFTRLDLLEMFRADPYYRDVLEGPNPGRAREYWDAAIQTLKNEKVIGHYAEVKPMTPGRQGWQKPWLDQPLDIRPTEQGRQDVAEISRAAAAIAATKKRSSRQRTSGRR
jgi:hypothetical protein